MSPWKQLSSGIKKRWFKHMFDLRSQKNQRWTFHSVREPTWRWCWCRWCTRSRRSTGSGRWSCWFGSASIPCSSSGNGTSQTEPVPSTSQPAGEGDTRKKKLLSFVPLLKEKQRHVRPRDLSSLHSSNLFSWFTVTLTPACRYQPSTKPFQRPRSRTVHIN